jgi:hypothetical protein
MADRRLWTCLAVALAEVGFVVAGAPTWLLLPVAVPLVFLVPGYVIMRAVSPAPRAGRLALVVATSIGTVALAGLVLNLLPAGLTATTWSVGLFVIVAAAAVGAALRRDAPPPAQVRPPTWATSLKALLCLALVVATAAVAVVSQHHALERQRYTELAYEPRSDGSQVIAVRNREGARTEYVLRVTVGGRPSHQLPIGLSDGDSWTYDVRRLSGVAGAHEGERVEVDLSRPNDRTPYRRLTFWTGSP